MNDLSITDAQIQAILYQALAEPMGLVLEVSDPTVAKRRIYAARAKLKDPALAGLQLRQGASPKELWLVKSRVQITSGEQKEDE